MISRRLQLQLRLTRVYAGAEAQEILAKQIVDHARTGEWNRRKLADGALLKLAHSHLPGAGRTEVNAGGSGGAWFAPDKTKPIEATVVGWRLTGY
jgi:hypothetical protein